MTYPRRHNPARHRTIHPYTRHQRINQGFRRWAWRKVA